jgi:uncharacterized protein YndB with AHSA1/START domain
MTVTTALEPEDARSIVFSRLIDAPRELVFEVFTTPEHLARWYGPEGFSITTHAFDFRIGGVWELTMHGPEGRDFPNRIVFDVIDPPGRIVSHHASADGQIIGHETRVVLEAEGGKTRLEWRNVFSSIAERDHIVRNYGAEQGLIDTVTHLADYVAELV